jgi:uncharacterized RDD family membrane protein YckC
MTGGTVFQQPASQFEGAFVFENAFAKMRRRHSGLSEVSEVKCPKCGFVSSGPPAVCKRCGHVFAAREPQPDVPENRLSILDAPLVSGPDAGFAGPVSEVPMKQSDQPWQDEIAQRVARYRRRKSRVPDTQDDARSNLEFDFSGRRDHTGASPAVAGKEWGELEFEAVPGNETASRAQAPALDSVPIEGAGRASFRAEDGMDWAVEPAEVDAPGPAPVEIVLGSGPEEEEAETISANEVRLAAPIGRRLAAALVDGLVLLIAACLFTLVFAKTGGEVEPRPSNVTIMVLGLAAACLVTFYFALFTALAFATPGQSALGLRVRTLDNRLPDTNAALWRGVGYLVSAAALMLGFVWAVFDSQGLTWHDHMSGTCLAVRGETTGHP